MHDGAFLRREWARRVEDLRGDADLAHVVQERHVLDAAQLGLGQREFTADRHCHAGDGVGMGGGVLSLASSAAASASTVCR